MELVHQLSDYLNTHPEDLVSISAVLSVVVVYAINHVKSLSKLTNAGLGLVAVPGVVTALTAYTTDLHATAYPVVVVLGQVLYHVYEAIQRNAKAQASSAVEPNGVTANF